MVCRQVNIHDRTAGGGKRAVVNRYHDPVISVVAGCGDIAAVRRIRSSSADLSRTILRSNLFRLKRGRALDK